MIKKPLINNRIKAREVRLIDSEGKQLGIVPLEEALRKSRERNLDLIQVTDKVEPPICKILDFGKYLYHLKKKEKGTKKSTEIKGIRLRYNISSHDIETRIRQAEKFLKAKNKVKIEMALRGREKKFSNLAKEKVNSFIEKLEENMVIKREGTLKRGGRGFIIIVSGVPKQET